MDRQYTECEGDFHLSGFLTGKKVKLCRGCFLPVQNLTVATERDVLVIGYSGRANLDNDFGVNPHGVSIGNKLLVEGGVFYEAATTEKKSSIDKGVRYEVCYGKPVGAFASSCKEGEVESRTAIEITSKGVVMTSEYHLDNGKTETWKSTCEF